MLTVLPFCTYAQSKDSIQHNIYIEKHQDQIGIKFALSNHTNIFELHTDQYNLILKPNTAIKTNLFFNYRFILFGVGFAPKFLPGNNDDKKKGTSEIFWIASKINLNHWIQQLKFSKTKGFYVDNSSDFVFDTDETRGDYLLFPALTNISISGYSAYKWNKNFSFSAIEIQTERQLKSTGTPVAILTYRYYIIDNKIELTGNNSSQKSNNLESTLQLGYFYTHVYKQNFYFSTGISGGGGLLHTKLTTRFSDGATKSENNIPVFRSEGMLALGYNSRRFYMGIHAIGTYEKYRQSGNSVTNLEEGLGVQIFTGYRFNAPKWLQNSFRKTP